MLEKKVRNNYYTLYQNFENLVKELSKYMYHENLFLKIFEEKTLNQRNIDYLESLDKLIESITNSEFEKEEYHKMFNKQISEIKRHKEKLLIKIENLQKNKLFKFHYCKTNIKQLYKIQKNIIISLNMYSSFTSYIYNYPLKNLKQLSINKMELGDIVLSIKSEKEIQKNILFKLISKATKSKIGHSVIFMGIKNNKPQYIDIKDGQATIKNLIEKPETLKFIKTTNKYSSDVIGLILRVKGGLSKLEEKNIIEYLEKKTNTKYGFVKVIIGLIVGKLYEILPFENLAFKHPQKSLKSMFCSELVIRAYSNANIYLQNKSDPAVTTPTDLLNSPQLEVIGYMDK